MDQGNGRGDMGPGERELEPASAGIEEADRLLPHGAHPTTGDRLFEAGLERMAGGMERIGRVLTGRGQARRRRGGVGAAVGSATLRAGDALESGAAYIREQDPAAVRADLEARVRSRPLMAVAGAVAAGFLLGRIVRS